MFDSDGKEIHNNTDYEGVANLCSSNDENEFQKYFENDNYKLFAKNISLNDYTLIGKEIFNFSTIVKPGLIGDKLEKCGLVRADNGDYIESFSKIEKLMFESEYGLSNHEIVINDVVYKMNELKTTIKQGIGKYRYIVELDLKIGGVYTICINAKTDGKNERIHKFVVAVDPSFHLKQERINELSFNVSLNSTFVSANLNILSSVLSGKEIKFSFNGIEYYYEIIYDLDLYRIDGSEWKKFSDDIWVGDIKSESILDIYGNENYKLNVYDKINPIYSELDFKHNRCYLSTKIGFIRSTKNNYDNVLLCLNKDGKNVKGIYCNNKCTLDENKSEISYDPGRGLLMVISNYKGKGQVWFEIINESGMIVAKKILESNETIYPYSNLVSGEEYIINYYEKISGLSLKGGKRLMASKKVKFYSYEDLIDNEYQIEEIEYDNGDFITQEVAKPGVIFDYQKKNNLFVGTMFNYTSSGKYFLNNINPVEIEIYTDPVDDMIECYITNEGDGLLYDSKYNTVLNATVSKYAPDIISYKVNLKRR